MDEHLVCIALDRTVCVRFLWSDADLDRTWIGDHDIIQAAFMVCLLPDGNDDTGNLHAKTQKGKSLWKRKRNR